MKKHKRDVHRRAYLKGYQAGISGRSRDDCPVAERGAPIGKPAGETAEVTSGKARSASRASNQIR